MSTQRTWTWLTWPSWAVTRRGSSRRSRPMPVSMMASTSAASASRSGPAARPQRCKRRSGTRRSSTWLSATASLPLSALTTAPGFPDRSLPMRYARTRPSSRTARPQPASATGGRRTFRRDVTGLCPARPCTPRRWATVTTCARFAASSPAGPRCAGLTPSRIPDLVLAISELAANTVRHTDGGGTLQVWQTRGELICQVADTGHLTDPLAWHRPPSDELLGGNGLWLVNQVCDLVQARTGQAGTTIRLHMSLNGHSPRRHAPRQAH